MPAHITHINRTYFQSLNENIFKLLVTVYLIPFSTCYKLRVVLSSLLCNLFYYMRSLDHILKCREYLCSLKLVGTKFTQLSQVLLMNILLIFFHCIMLNFSSSYGDVFVSMVNTFLAAWYSKTLSNFLVFFVLFSSPWPS